MRKYTLGNTLFAAFILIAVGWFASCSKGDDVAGSNAVYTLLPEKLDSLIQVNPDSVLTTIALLEQLEGLVDARPAIKYELLSAKLAAYQQKGYVDSVVLLVDEIANINLEKADTAQLLPLLGKINYTELSYANSLIIAKLLRIANQYIDNNNLRDEDAIVIQNLFAALLIEQNDLQKAQTVLEQALRNTTALDDTRGYTAIYLTMGDLYLKQELYEQARQAYQEARRLSSDSEELLSLYFRSMNNLGIAYKELNQLDSAALCYQEVLDKLPEDDVRRRLQNTLNLGNVYWHGKDIEKAMLTYQEVVDKSLEEGIQLGVLYGNINKANVWIETGNPQRGIKTLRALAQDAEILGGPELLYEVNRLLENGYWEAGQYEQAYDLAKRVYVYKDSVQTSKNKAIVSDLEYFFKTERLSLENQLLLAQNKERGVWIWLLLAICLGMGGIVGLIFNNYRIQRRSVEMYKEVLGEKDNALKARDAALVEKAELYDRLLREERSRSQRLSDQIEMLRGEFSGERLSLEIEDQDRFWLDFSFKFKLLFPHFEEELIEKYPILSTSDIQFCKLVKLNLPNTDIANILHVAPRSLYKKKQRILEKIGVENLEKNLTDYLPA